MSTQATTKEPAEAAPFTVITYRGRQLESMAKDELRTVVDDMAMTYQARLRTLRAELEELRELGAPGFQEGADFAVKEYRKIILKKLQAIGIDLGLDADAGGELT